MNILYILLSDFKNFEWHWELVRLCTSLPLISGQDFPLCCSCSLRNMGKPTGLTWKIFFFKFWLLKHFFLSFRDLSSQVKLKLLRVPSEQHVFSTPEKFQLIQYFCQMTEVVCWLTVNIDYFLLFFTSCTESRCFGLLHFLLISLMSHEQECHCFW